MMSVMLAGSGYKGGFGDSGEESLHDFVPEIVILCLVILFAGILVMVILSNYEQMTVFSKYRKGRKFIERCTTKIPAKVVKTFIRYDELTADRSGNPTEIILEIYYTCEYKINDVYYKKECLVPRAYLLSNEDIYNTAISSYINGNTGSTLEGDVETIKVGDEIELCYNPEQIEEFYCVGDENYIIQMSEVADACVYTIVKDIIILIILIIIAICTCLL